MLMRMHSLKFFALVTLITACVASFSTMAQEAQLKLPTVAINAGMHIIQAELAQTPEQRSTGMMMRKTMGTNEGMLFVFEQSAKQCFWMKNTLLPLSIAFVAADGTVVNIDEMKPQTLESHCSTNAVPFVLEMNTGWYTKRGIKAGFKLKGAPFAP